MMKARPAAVLAAVCLLLVAAPASAYTIFLKDGSKIVAREPYEVIDGRAQIVLTNGTRTSIDAREIDVDRTRDANERNLGQALVLEGGQVRELAPDETQVRPQPTRTLADLIAGRDDAPRDRPQARQGGRDGASSEVPRTDAGFIDLSAVPPRVYRDLELAAEIKQTFAAQGIDAVEVYQGTQAGRPLLRITASSEATVFRAVAVACAALLRIQEAHPDAVDGLEMVLATVEQDRAGQFVIDETMASQLMTKQVDIATFFLAHVQF